MLYLSVFLFSYYIIKSYYYCCCYCFIIIKIALNNFITFSLTHLATHVLSLSAELKIVV